MSFLFQRPRKMSYLYIELNLSGTYMMSTADPRGVEWGHTHEKKFPLMNSNEQLMYFKFFSCLAACTQHAWQAGTVLSPPKKKKKKDPQFSQFFFLIYFFSSFPLHTQCLPPSFFVFSPKVRNIILRKLSFFIYLFFFFASSIIQASKPLSSSLLNFL